MHTHAYTNTHTHTNANACIQKCTRKHTLKFTHIQTGKVKKQKKQGRIDGNPVADGWAGAVMRKPLGIQKCDGRMDGRTDRPTRQGVESRVRD